MGEILSIAVGTIVSVLMPLALKKFFLGKASSSAEPDRSQSVIQTIDQIQNELATVKQQVKAELAHETAR
jgi:hypothetical protein